MDGPPVPSSGGSAPEQDIEQRAEQGVHAVGEPPKESAAPPMKRMRVGDAAGSYAANDANAFVVEDELAELAAARSSQFAGSDNNGMHFAAEANARNKVPPSMLAAQGHPDRSGDAGLPRISVESLLSKGGDKLSAGVGESDAVANVSQAVPLGGNPAFASPSHSTAAALGATVAEDAAGAFPDASPGFTDAAQETEEPVAVSPDPKLSAASMNPESVAAPAVPAAVDAFAEYADAQLMTDSTAAGTEEHAAASTDGKTVTGSAAPVTEKPGVVSNDTMPATEAGTPAVEKVDSAAASPVERLRAFLAANGLQFSDEAALLYQVHEDLRLVRKWTSLRVLTAPSLPDAPSPLLLLAGCAPPQLDAVHPPRAEPYSDRTRVVLPLSASASMGASAWRRSAERALSAVGGGRCATLAIVDDDSTTAYYRLFVEWEEMVHPQWKALKQTAGGEADGAGGGDGSSGSESA